MPHSGEGLARTTAVRGAFPFLAAATLGAIAIALVALLPAGGQLVRLAAAAAGALLVLRGWRSSVGHERRVRASIGFAVGVWLLSEIGRLSGTIIGQTSMLAELSVIGLGIGTIATFVAIVHGRMRPFEELAIYLDSTAVFFGLVGAVLVIGSGATAGPESFAILVHAAFFIAVLAATLLLNLSIHVPLRLVGPWEILVGIGIVAVGYVGLLTPAADGPAGPMLHLSVAAGALLVGHGGARWRADETGGPRYQAIAGWVRRALPVSSAVLSGGVGIALVARPALVDAPLRLGAGVALGIVVVATIARQTLLLVDREQLLRRSRHLTDELTVAEAQYRSVVARVPGVVYVADAGQHGRWHFVSAKIEELLGYTPDEWTADATLWMSRVHPADRDRMRLAESEDAARLEQKGRWEYRLIARDGRVVWVIDDEAVIARDADGHATMVQGILVDISDRKDLEDQLRHQALHDPLTGLPNRVLFVDRLSHALVRRGRPGHGLAVLFIDLDDFKAINDTLGHATGDQLLRLVGNRLSGVLRAEDTVCRLGGDEFAFLIEDAPADRSVQIARRILGALAEPFDLGGRFATLSASIGIATSDYLGDSGSAAESADEMLRDADTAMYAAKALGKGRVRVFERGMLDRISRPRELRGALQRALEVEELLLEYQPIVDLRDGRLVGLEALVRWNHPQLGRLMPADFVPLAEETGLIGGLGDWVLRRACADLADDTTTVSVNVSAHQLGSGELPALVSQVLSDSGIRPSRLLLELTESTLASAGAGAETELLRIHRLGVRIALDDFGSGYSSLEYLGRLPIDVLKIDRSLVEKAHLETQRQEVLRAIAHIADKLGLETIVEGVEHEAQRTTLLELGFRQAQGFLFSPAVPLDEVRRSSLERQAS